MRDRRAWQGEGRPGLPRPDPWEAVAPTHLQFLPPSLSLSSIPEPLPPPSASSSPPAHPPLLPHRSWLPLPYHFSPSFSPFSLGEQGLPGDLLTPTKQSFIQRGLRILYSEALWGTSAPPVRRDDWAALSQASLRPGKGISWWRGGLSPQCIYCIRVTFCIFWGSGSPLYHSRGWSWQMGRKFY